MQFCGEFLRGSCTASIHYLKRAVCVISRAGVCVSGQSSNKVDTIYDNRQIILMRVRLAPSLRLERVLPQLFLVVVAHFKFRFLSPDCCAAAEAHNGNSTAASAPSLAPLRFQSRDDNIRFIMDQREGGCKGRGGRRLESTKRGASRR